MPFYARYFKGSILLQLENRTNYSLPSVWCYFMTSVPQPLNVFLKNYTDQEKAYATNSCLGRYFYFGFIL